LAKKNGDKQVRTLRLSVPDREWAVTALALCHEAKNLYNITTYLIRQVYSAYEYQAETKLNVLKAELHQNQIDAINLFNRVIDQVNDKRRAKAEDLSKFVPIQRLERTLQYGPLSSVLHKTVIDNVVKSHLDENGQSVYRRLPAVAAQQVVLSVVDLWKASLAAQKDFVKNPHKYTGRPQFPSFLAKNETFQIEFPFAHISNALPKPNKLLTFGNVNEEALQRFYKFDIKQAVNTACLGRGWCVYEPKHIRIAAEGATSIRIEAVVHLSQEFPEGSLLHRLYQQYGAELRDLAKLEERNAFLIKTLQSGVYSGLNLAGIDLGQNNVATVSFSTGHRAHVHDGDRYAAMMRDYEQRLDKLLSTLASPRMKELQAKAAALKAEGKKLSKAERIELRKEQKNLFTDPDYKALTSRRGRRKSDFEHKITTDIVEQCLKRHINVIVIGRNKGWKSEMNIGRENNRSFHGLAHSRLIDLIRYKAEAHGIAVVTVEESYTSKTSFYDGDVLRSFSDKQDPTDAASEARMSGYRSTENRRWFVRRRDAVKPGEITKIHADVNGAFNIIRKVFTGFCYHVGLSLKFTVRWISPRRGAVVPMACL